jgi:hypothetical protein
LIYRASWDLQSTDPMMDRSRATVPVGDEEMAERMAGEEEGDKISRYTFGQTESRMALEPALADRPVVSRPENPLHVPSGETVTLYISTPLWMRVALPESDRVLEEFASHRMSDTWLGPSPVEGELCYATRTSGRLRLESLPYRLHRAVTPLQIKNRAKDTLLLERVQLPVPHLALYREPNALWTQAVRMTRSEGSQGADIRVKDGPPAEANAAEQIQAPRDEQKSGLVTSSFRAFGAFFGG